MGCSFENGTCDWEDVSVGQCQWMRGRNSSENAGPSVDHTVGTELGEDCDMLVKSTLAKQSDGSHFCITQISTKVPAKRSNLYLSIQPIIA